MAIEAVMFDFSGTLFRWENPPPRSDDPVGADARAFDTRWQAELRRRLAAAAPQHVTAAAPPDGFDEVCGRAWEHRDLDPAEWTPYPDVGAVLGFLAAQGIPVGVVSNLAFDPRPAFARHGWDGRVDAIALAYEVGVMKPDPGIFLAALGKLGVEPGAALMVGDSAVADGGATELGCRFALVDPLPTAQRPDALIDALRAHGLPVPR